MWTKRNVWIWLALTVVTIVVSVVLVRTTRAQSGQRVPFTAIVVATGYKYPSGDYVTQFTTKYAIRSDGSNIKIREQPTSDGATYQVKGLIDVPDKLGKTADDLTRSVTTIHLNDAFLAQFTTKPKSCAIDTPTVSAQILGYTVLKSTREGPKTASGESFRKERWVAPALDCYPLKETLYRSEGAGPLLPVTVTEVRSIVRGEPDPSLFALPAGYTERAPSQVFAERRQLTGEAECPKCALRDSALDDAYRAQQQPDRK